MAKTLLRVTVAAAGQSVLRSFLLMKSHSLP